MSAIRDIPFHRDTIDLLEDLGIDTVYDLYHYELKTVSTSSIRFLTDPIIRADIEFNMSVIISSN